ncbi:kinase-like protein [Xylariaceae sp. FL0594]|nr:kinase-like protein [Xylariaceae sp. FL0594]
MSTAQPRPVAQIFCRRVERDYPKSPCASSDHGFLIASHVRQTGLSGSKSVSHLDIHIHPGGAVHVGRDVYENDVAIPDDWVSRRQFVVYSIVYENDNTMPPLVYVRDCDSLSGTFVDDRSSPSLKKLSSSSGHLLSHDEVIIIHPFWEFHVCLLGNQASGPCRNHPPSGEVDLLLHRNLRVTNRVLGYGGFAVVHLAVNTNTGRQLACKIHNIRYLKRGMPGLVARVLNETNILSRLSHPNLLQFEAAFRSCDTLYTFTELATGGDLFSLQLQYADGLPEMDMKVILFQILSGVSHLHAQNVVHRDLKPENVFLATGPQVSRVILGDFGFAKVKKIGRLESRVGTREFMAPEIYLSCSHDSKADIWSIGMLALFLAAVDWETAPNLVQLDQDGVNAYLTTAFGALVADNRGLSENLEEFLRSCLNVDPCQRMTAEDCTNHKWFSSDDRFLRKRVRELTRGWMPTSIVSNSVEDLDTPPTDEHGEGIGQRAQNSPYFTGVEYARVQRQNSRNVVRVAPELQLTPATQESISNDIYDV